MISRMNATPQNTTDATLHEESSSALRCATSAEMHERRRARMRVEQHLHALQAAHLQIARDLLLGEPAAITALDNARRMVAVWSQNRTCSSFYIDNWRELLCGAPAEVGKALNHMDAKWEAALLQNSPFGVRLAPLV
jgi:hypothetical protein